MKTLSGRLTISRVTGVKEDYVRIQVEDCNSHQNIVDVEVLPIDFGNAIVGLSYQKCIVNVNDSGKIGLVREFKNQLVNVSGIENVAWSDRRAFIEKLLVNYNVDGWEGRVDDALNTHNKVSGKNLYRVGFVRYVEP